mmetsp:Transcript_90686/g.256787  ORF Transcript_90686/g.256787 Transcript_90686/m.256787 type:complete len:214 (-) Transcript_90686:604-1245(-)
MCAVERPCDPDVVHQGPDCCPVGIVRRGNKFGQLGTQRAGVAALEGGPGEQVDEHRMQLPFPEHLLRGIREVLGVDPLQDPVRLPPLGADALRQPTPHPAVLVLQVSEQALEAVRPPASVLQHDRGGVHGGAQLSECLGNASPRPALHALRVDRLQEGMGGLLRAPGRLSGGRRHGPGHPAVPHLQVLEEAPDLRVPLLDGLQLHGATVWPAV